MLAAAAAAPGGGAAEEGSRDQDVFLVSIGARQDPVLKVVVVSTTAAVPASCYQACQDGLPLSPGEAAGSLPPQVDKVWNAMEAGLVCAARVAASAAGPGLLAQVVQLSGPLLPPQSLQVDVNQRYGQAASKGAYGTEVKPAVWTVESTGDVAWKAQ